jgi:HK97 family phage portal protein
MGFFDRFRRGGAATVRVKSGASSMSIEEWFEQYGSRSAASVIVNQRTAMAVPTIFACVSIRSEDTARCTPRLFKPDPKGGRIEVTDHPVARLFRKPNRVQTWFEFCEAMEAAVLLKSNAYAAILTDNRGRPTELIPIDPDHVLVLESQDGSIFYQVTRVTRFMNAVLKEFPLAIPAESIFHLKGLGLGSPVISPARIGLARDTIGLAIGLEQQAARWIANGARPGGVLEVAKSLTEGAAKRHRKHRRDCGARGGHDLEAGAAHLGRSRIHDAAHDVE